MTAEPDTRTRLLDAAEHLFAERGFDGASVRAITKDAGVSLPAVNYHFGSKERLLQEVYLRCNRRFFNEVFERLDLLDAHAGSRTLPLESLLDALIRPAFHALQDPLHGENFVRLLGHSYLSRKQILGEQVPEEQHRFEQRLVQSFRRALPELPDAEFFTRLFLALNTFRTAVADREGLGALSDGAVDPEETEILLRRMVAFIAAGLSAPVPTLGTRKLVTQRLNAVGRRDE
jgi:AcrR family transcriptional regulator